MINAIFVATAYAMMALIGSDYYDGCDVFIILK